MKIIKPAELKKLLESQEVCLIDVREPAEYRSKCIDGSCSIPLSKISANNIPDTNKKIVIHCGIGKRSEAACKKILAENPNLEIYSLEGGISAWERAGFLVKQEGPKLLPLDRQTQLAIGIFIILGMILGFLITSFFYIIPFIIGLGLMSAGITGWCGMSKLLAIMPWNK